MDALVNALHDEIDEQEGIAAEAKEAVEDVKRHIIDLVDDLQDTEQAMAGIALLAESKLADITKRAVRQGYESAKRRARRIEDENQAGSAGQG